MKNTNLIDKMRRFTVRLATKKDVRAVSRFGTPIVKTMKFYNKEHTAVNVYELSVKDLRANLKKYRGSLVVALTKDKNVVGMCTHYVGHGHVDWIDWLLVDQSYRGHGVGRALVNFAIKEAKRHGCHKVWLNYPRLKAWDFHQSNFLWR